MVGFSPAPLPSALSPRTSVAPSSAQLRLLPRRAAPATDSDPQFAPIEWVKGERLGTTSSSFVSMGTHGDILASRGEFVVL